MKRARPAAPLFATCLLSLQAVPFLFAESAIPGHGPRPNVLMLAVDDMNDWINVMGGYRGKVHTPNLDRLAARGTLFTNAHCPAPVCGPSRTSILGGRYASSTGLYGNHHWWYPHMPDLVTLPMHFRAHGYRALGAGKVWHHTAGFNPPHQWDDFAPLLFADDPWDRRDKLNYPWVKSTLAPSGFPFGGVKGLGHEHDWGAIPGKPESEYDDARTADAAIAQIRGPHAKPFFIAAGMFRPHLPYYVPQRFLDLYPLDAIVLPERFEGDLDDIPPVGIGFANARGGTLKRLKEAGAWPMAVQAYLAAITYADEQLGRVLDALDASPHAANTMVVLWSDHGYHMGEKETWQKITLWERATKVPFIIAAPGFPAGQRCARPVNLIDIYPTLVDLCSLGPVPQPLDGTSLVPLLQDGQAAWDRPSRTEFLRGNAAVRDDRYRYIRYKDGGEELYDHQNDPHEWHNLAGDPELAEVKTRLARSLPQRWAEDAPGKDAYMFDWDTHTYTRRKDGKVFRPSNQP